jgi:hypothetical protein
LQLYIIFVNALIFNTKTIQIMKAKFFIPFFFVLSSVLLFSCEAVKKLADVTFEVTASLPFNINETAVNANGKVYTSTQILNVNTDPDVAKYASKITGFTVNKITYTVSNANPNTVLFTNGTISIVAGGKTIATASSVSLSNTTETQLTTDIAGLNELTTLLLADKQEAIQLQGTLSKTPVAFTVNFRFYLTVTANPL